MPDSIDQNPRKAMDDAVAYAVQVAHVYLQRIQARQISLPGLNYLEIGPGNDLAPQLVLASAGARVTVADRYLAEWDANYHPNFYEAFLAVWDGPGDAVRQAVSDGGHLSVLRAVPEGAEHLRSLADGKFDFVQSNAVLEHVADLRRCVLELARVSRIGALHCHQVDFRDHRNFDRPLGQILLPQQEYHELRSSVGGMYGSSMRMPELIEAITSQFWLFELEVNARAEADHLRETIAQLPSDSPYRSWPPAALEPTGACLWLARKDPGSRLNIPQEAN